MAPMINLPNQLLFESLLRPRNQTEEDGRIYDPYVVVCFTASWCGPCQKLNKDYIVGRTQGVTWYKCDVDENPDTIGYCGLSSIPSFCIIKNGVYQGNFSQVRGEESVLQWLASKGVPIV